MRHSDIELIENRILQHNKIRHYNCSKEMFTQWVYTDYALRTIHTLVRCSNKTAYKVITDFENDMEHYLNLSRTPESSVIFSVAIDVADDLLFDLLIKENKKHE